MGFPDDTFPEMRSVENIFKAAMGASEGEQTLPDLFQGHADLTGTGNGRKRVADIVEPGYFQSDAAGGLAGNKQCVAGVPLLVK